MASAGQCTVGARASNKHHTMHRQHVCGLVFGLCLANGHRKEEQLHPTNPCTSEETRYSNNTWSQSLSKDLFREMYNTESCSSFSYCEKYTIPHKILLCVLVNSHTVSQRNAQYLVIEITADTLE